MTPTPPLAGSIGTTERALRLLLDLQLRAAQLSFTQWVVLTFLQTPLTADALVARHSAANVGSAAEAGAAIDDLQARGLITAPLEPGTALVVTDAGRTLFQPLRTNAATVTQELWGDLPAADLETTHRTLTEIGRRATLRLAELAG